MKKVGTVSLGLIVTFLCSLCLMVTSASATDCKSTGVEFYRVTYGANGIPGRVYDSTKNQTTFTYTVQGNWVNCGKLKRFMVQSDCGSALHIDEVTPYYPTWTPKNPEIFSSSKDGFFGLKGVRWYGAHGGGSAPILVDYNQTRVFSITYAGEIQEGTVQWGTGRYFKGWRKNWGSITGPSCNKTCENRIELDFEEFAKGQKISSDYSALGVTSIVAKDTSNNAKDAMIFDSAMPSGSDNDLGTKNQSYGGPGKPGLNIWHGTGLGNYLELDKILIISEDGDSSDPDDNASGGTITFNFVKPVRVVSTLFLDNEESGKEIHGKKADSSNLFTTPIKTIGDNSLQSIAFPGSTTYDTKQLVFKYGSGAIGELAYCIEDQRCGDGYLETPEACDDGNTNDNDGCSSTCEIERCGDGIVHPGEECDDGNTNDTDGCSNTCKLPVCGDGTVQDGEACDDGNLDNNDGCSNLCEFEICGDGIQQTGEQCDDGNNIDTDGCSNTCKIPVCGDGIKNGTEQCDDGNTDNTDGCTNTCDTPICGDGFQQPGNGEQCDDGNTIDDDECSNQCKSPLCGDGILQDQAPFNEECDFGIDPDNCTVLCTRPKCGDAIIQAPEACDDGNSIENDGCTSLCTVPACGDGIIQSGEVCDDGPLNGTTSTGCTSLCTLPSCGDGTVDPGEQCDDGNSVNDDDCSNICTVPVCGDGIINQPSELCDDGNTSNDDDCDATCQPGTPLVPDGCEEIDTFQAQARMDANLKKTEREVIRPALTAIAKTSRKSGLNVPRAFIKRTKEDAYFHQDSGWVASWSFNSTTIVCEALVETCTEVNTNVNALDEFTFHLTALDTIAKKTVRRLRRLLKKTTGKARGVRRLQKKRKAFLADALAARDEVPKENVVSCSISDA